MDARCDRASCGCTRCDRLISLDHPIISLRFDDYSSCRA